MHEPDLIDTAKRIMQKVTVPLPEDVIVSKEFAAAAVAQVRNISDVAADEMILDIGPATARTWAQQLLDAKTILWNGPVGVFEFDQFGEGTRVLAEGRGAKPRLFHRRRWRYISGNRQIFCYSGCFLYFHGRRRV